MLETVEGNLPKTSVCVCGSFPLTLTGLSEFKGRFVFEGFGFESLTVGEERTLVVTELDQTGMIQI